MISERVKSDFFQEEQNKKIRELSFKIASLKKDSEANSLLIEKRDNQLTSLMQKIKAQEHEIGRLNSELAKKSNNLNTLQGEVVELRPSKEAASLVEKLLKQMEEMKKVIYGKDSEIAMMKNLIKTWQTQHVNSHERSPKRLPSIYSKSVSKNSIISMSNSTSKSIRYNEIDLEYSNVLDDIVERPEEKEIKDEEERAQAEEQKKKIEKEQETEEIERKTMGVEEELSKHLEESHKLLEESHRLQLEAAKKVEENPKKPKGKAQKKPASKPIAKKK